MSNKHSKIAVTIALVLGTLIGSCPLAKTQPSKQANSERPKPPDTGTPSGDPTPGTRRPEASCKETGKPLTALFANNGKDFTVSEYPTFWFYIPYPPEDISDMEFFIVEETTDKPIYDVSIKLTEKPGIIKIAMPTESKYALKLNETYRWRLNLDCQPNKSIEPDLVLSGFIKRVSLTSILQNQLEAMKLKEYIAYQDNNIWYDAITTLAEQYSDNLQNRELAEDWQKLLNNLNFSWINGEAFVDSGVTQIPDFSKKSGI
ncbi:DUF928 domain-containing protein [Limnofasciculus baicalensis]|uniref:DUF928 domain-containing protein n=1 Tax=Limnofasciculus baicalensis BBK-W-15 TaxID=2699891 RepID=A0AAE3GPE8_9CYAN|nr:DUF928 domain-containing protein [Limnofasciculus baicalensis]MCP2727632.1 DUF928 domain-containing protein [Limnofasciculus baicalensis BBK-W-15]